MNVEGVHLNWNHSLGAMTEAIDVPHKRFQTPATGAIYVQMLILKDVQTEDFTFWRQ